MTYSEILKILIVEMHHSLYLKIAATGDSLGHFHCTERIRDRKRPRRIALIGKIQEQIIR